MKYDIIIVGAGIAGVYAGWRLLSEKKLKIALLESTSRIGGRLYSLITKSIQKKFPLICVEKNKQNTLGTCSFWIKPPVMDTKGI